MLDVSVVHFPVVGLRAHLHQPFVQTQQISLLAHIEVTYSGVLCKRLM